MIRKYVFFLFRQIALYKERVNLTSEKTSQNTDTQTYIVKETKNNKTNFLSLNFNDALLRYIFPDCLKTAVTAF